MGARRNLLGQRFGRLVVIEETNKRKRRTVVWKCKCDCGQVCYVDTTSLVSGHTQSCGCLQRDRAAESNSYDLVGEHFGFLTVISKTNKRYKAEIIWQCECHCGHPNCPEIIEVPTHSLTRGERTSCLVYKATMPSGERKIIEILDELHISYVYQWNPHDEGMSNKHFDFYLSDYKTCIEFDGEQHYHPIAHWGGVQQYERNVANDAAKDAWCLRNNIRMIRIPYFYEYLLDKELILLLINGEIEEIDAYAKKMTNSDKQQANKKMILRQNRYDNLVHSEYMRDELSSVSSIERIDSIRNLAGDIRKQPRYYPGMRIGKNNVLYISDLGKNEDGVPIGEFQCTRCGSTFVASLYYVSNGEKQFCPECQEKHRIEKKKYHEGDYIGPNHVHLVRLETSKGKQYGIFDCNNEGCNRQFRTRMDRVLYENAQYCSECLKSMNGRTNYKIGERYGEKQLLLLDISIRRFPKSTVKYGKWLCSCGNTFECALSEVTSGKRRCCPDCSKRSLSESKCARIEGKRFGHLVAVRDVGHRNPKIRSHYWECKCDCGNTCYVATHKLLGGNKTCCSRSCTCRKSNGQVEEEQKS